MTQPQDRYKISRGKLNNMVTSTSDPLVAAKARELGFRVRSYPTRPMVPEMTDKIALLTLAAQTLIV